MKIKTTLSFLIFLCFLSRGIVFASSQMCQQAQSFNLLDSEILSRIDILCAEQIKLSQKSYSSQSELEIARDYFEREVGALRKVVIGFDDIFKQRYRTIRNELRAADHLDGLKRERVKHSRNEAAKNARFISPQKIAEVMHDGKVYSLSFNRDGSFLAVGTWESSAHIIEFSTGKVVKDIIHNYRLASVAFEAGGDLQASGPEKKITHIFDISTGRELKQIAYKDGIGDGIFSADAKLQVKGIDKETVSILDVQTGRGIHSITFDKHVELRSANFNSDGSLLVIGPSDGHLGVMDVQTGNYIYDDIPLLGSVLSASFSPNGKLILATSSLGFVYIIDAKSGTIFERIKLGQEAKSAIFSPDGNYFAVASENYTRIFKIYSGI